MTQNKKKKIAGNGLKQYPVDYLGNVQHYPEGSYVKVNDTYELIPPNWIDNAPFEAKLSILDTHRGRSAAYFRLADSGGHIYPMFMTDMLELLMQTTIVNGVVVGRWQIRKRGQNYGISLSTDFK
mgnify:CR=1 FL=1